MKHELKVSYPTAWYMLHRLRIACGSKMEALHGTVEVDEVYLGGKEGNKQEHKKLKAGRGAVGNQAVLGMRQRGGNTVAMPVKNTNKSTVQPIVHEYVRPGSTICTGEAGCYDGVAHRHKRVNHSAKEYANGKAHTNGIESVWAALKRGFNGVYHSWSKKHCQNYVNEFAFQLNEGNSERDTQDRLDYLFRAMSGKTITYEELTV